MDLSQNQMPVKIIKLKSFRIKVQNKYIPIYKEKLFTVNQKSPQKIQKNQIEMMILVF